MKTITLSGKKIYVDDEDAYLLNEYNWHISQSMSRFYLRSIYKVDNKKKSIFFQHLIIGQPPKGKRLFFKDGNSLNLQKENLEFITNSEFSHRTHNDNRNCQRSKNKFRGVVVQYISRIKINGKIVVLGCFKSEKQAAEAYNQKALEVYGKAARLNKISEL